MGGIAHAVVVGHHPGEVFTQGQGGGQMDGVQAAYGEGVELSGSAQEVAIDDQLFERIQMSDSDINIAVDSGDGPSHLGDSQLTGDKDIAGVQVVPPLAKGLALALDNGKLHNGRGVQIPEAQRSSARNSASAAEAGRRVLTGAGRGPVTEAGLSRPSARSRVRTSLEGAGPRTATTSPRLVISMCSPA